jgi:2-oxoglutarate ferredoxin oxidoreductase subunit alpha
MNAPLPPPDTESPTRRVLETAVVRFAGDSGDGMQVTGSQFGVESALAGNDLVTFPDFPAEIRAPTGTTYGVSAFQIQFSSGSIHTAGDRLDALFALNPAALKVNLADLKPGGIVVVDSGAFLPRDLSLAGYAADPRHDGTLAGFRVFDIDITAAVKGVAGNLPENEAGSRKDALRARNMWALGLALWLYGRGPQATLDWIARKFARNPAARDLNAAAVKAGYAFGDIADLPSGVEPMAVPAQLQAPGLWRQATGAETLVAGLVAGCLEQGRQPVYCSYPITPASTMLHALAAMGPEAGVTAFQAEDEIAAACAAIGASYAGALGITGTSGPGMALKTEALGLAIAAELPLVVVDVQRGGPSTGLPTKTEQSDLWQAVLGRNGDAPLVVLAVRSPSHGWQVAREAVRLAVTFMTPVIVLSDGFVANAAEPWQVPDLATIADPPPPPALPADFAPFRRDPDTLARPWVAPGTPGGQHRLGGLERADVTGAVSTDAANHQKMTDLRRAKIAGIADHVAPQDIELGAMTGEVAILGWGSTYGAITDAVANLMGEGLSVAHIHLTHLWPLPQNLPGLLAGFRTVIVPEMNTGQLAMLLRAETLRPVISLSKVSGKPFRVEEIEQAVRDALKEELS